MPVFDDGRRNGPFRRPVSRSISYRRHVLGIQYTTTSRIDIDDPDRDPEIEGDPKHQYLNRVTLSQTTHLF